MNLAEAYGRLAEQAERTSGAELAHPLHGLWTKAAAGTAVVEVLHSKRQGLLSWKRKRGSDHQEYRRC